MIEQFWPLATLVPDVLGMGFQGFCLPSGWPGLVPGTTVFPVLILLSSCLWHSTHPPNVGFGYNGFVYSSKREEKESLLVQ